MSRLRHPRLHSWPFLWAGLVLLAACAAVGPATVTLTVDGDTRTIGTDAQTVRDLLAQAGVRLDMDDRVVPPENNFVRDGMTVRVVRVEVQVDVQQQIIPYGREVVRDTTVPAGEVRLLQAGVNGIEEITYAVTLEDGIELERRVAQRNAVQEPQNEIVLIGAQEDLATVPLSGTVAYLSAHNAWVVRGNTSDRRRVTSSGDLDGRVFELSPDGERLLYTRAPTDTATLNTLWLLDTVIVDSEAVRLSVDDVIWAAWSPDGREIAYSTGLARDAAPGWEAVNDLYIAAPRARDGLLTGRRRILEPSAGGTYGWWGAFLAWSPDGEKLAYARADEVGMLDIFSGSMAPLARFAPYRTRGSWVWTPVVSWSPDGGFVLTTLHSSTPTGELPEDSPIFDVVALGATTPLTAELFSEAGMWAAPVFSPDGDMIVFGRARVPRISHTSSYDLYVMDRDGSGQRLLFPQDLGEPGLEYPALAWDPWGGRLVVVYQGDLYLVSVEGYARRITEDGAATNVRWAGFQR